MKTKYILSIVATTLLFAGLQAAIGQTIESMPPVVVKTMPESGAKDVAPGAMDIQVTFSKKMTDNSWSWSSAWQGSEPEITMKPKYDAAKKTCTIRVMLEPNKTYAFWINSQNFHGFKDSTGKSAVPYLLIFKTKSQ